MSENKYTSNIPMGDENFQRIIKFYLFECPVKGVSNMGTTFQQQGWIRHYFRTLKSVLKVNATEELDSNYCCCKNRNALDSEMLNNDYTNYDGEYVLFIKNSNKGEIESLFYHIRNALAHGNFCIKSSKNNGRTYSFVNEYRKYVRAVIQLKEETLISWINVFYSNPKELKLKYNNKRK